MMERRWPDLWAMIRSLALLIALGISIVTTHSSNPAATGLALAAVAGIVLWYVNPRSAAFAFPAVACIRAGAALPPPASIAFTLGLSAAADAAVLIGGGSRGWLLFG